MSTTSSWRSVLDDATSIMTVLDDHAITGKNKRQTNQRDYCNVFKVLIIPLELMRSKFGPEGRSPATSVRQGNYPKNGINAKRFPAES